MEQKPDVRSGCVCVPQWALTQIGFGPGGFPIPTPDIADEMRHVCPPSAQYVKLLIRAGSGPS